MRRLQNRNGVPSFVFFLSFLLFFLVLTGSGGRELHAQNFSAGIRTAGLAFVKATVEGDYNTVMRYTYPKLVEMMDQMAGGKGKGIDLLKNQMEAMKKEGRSIDSAFVGTPTAHVTAGTELTAIVPTVIYISTPDMSLVQESYMIAVSGDSGANWTFVNASDNIDKLLPILFPNWNSALTLPEAKGPIVTRQKMGAK